MNLLIANLASPANPGDQAILKGSLKLMRSYWPKAKITLATRAYKEKAAYSDLGCDIVPQYPNVESLATDSTLQKWMGLPKAFADPGPMKKAIRESDAVFLIGGHYFYSYRKWVPGVTYLSHFSAVNWAKRYKKPVIFLPQSYGPFYSWLAGAMFGNALRKGQHLFFREGISGRWLRKQYPQYRKKMMMMPDLALYLEPDDLAPGAGQRKKGETLGVTIRAWQDKDGNETVYLKVLKETLEHFQRKWDVKIKIIVQVQDSKKGEGDEWISRLFSRELSEAVGATRVELCTHQPYFRLRDIAAHYGSCDLVIGMRLHSVLLSFLMGTPALAVGYQHKTEGILKSMGLTQLFLGSFANLHPDRFQKQCLAVWQQKEVWREKIAKSLKETRESIREIFEKSMKSWGL